MYQQQAELGNFRSYNALNVVGPVVLTGPMQPVWLGDTLLLARRVQRNGIDYVQGCELDWPALRADLLGEGSPLSGLFGG